MGLDFFFDEWIYDEYYPIYSYGYEQETGTNILSLQINQTQGQNSWREIFEMPIEIKINFTNGSDTLITVWNDQVSTMYDFPLTAEVNSVEIDPDEWILRNVEQVTDVMETPEKLFTFNLEANYPNPFNPSTTISFSISERAKVTLMVYDILGNEIYTIINEEREGGNYTINFDASDLTSGIYFYRLTAGGFSQSRKMLLIK